MKSVSRVCESTSVDEHILKAEKELEEASKKVHALYKKLFPPCYNTLDGQIHPDCEDLRTTDDDEIEYLGTSNDYEINEKSYLSKPKVLHLDDGVFI